MLDREQRIAGLRLPGWLVTLAGVLIAGGWVGVAVAQEGAADGEENNPYLWSPKTTSVAVFKNGLGFFMRRGEVRLRDGWCAGRQVPPAAFGTLAIYSETAGEVVDIVGSGPGEIVDFDDRDAPKSAEEIRRRLRASLNLKLSLTYQHNGRERSVAGKLQSVEDAFAVLDSNDMNVAVPLAGITRMQILDLPIRVHVTAPGSAQPQGGSPQHGSPQDTTLAMAYLRKGVTWIPEYTLSIVDEGIAELTLRGTLVNEAEDLIHTDVHFVVGVPNFVHTEYLAPIAVGQMIRTIAAAVAPAQIRSQIASRAAIASSNSVAADQFNAPAYREVDEGGADLDGLLGNLPSFVSAAGTDYTVYTKPDLTVRRGEKAIVTLFKKRISYGHIYRWSPPERMGHSLVLHNETDTAWTTGPCLTLDGQQPLSEGLLKYTPKAGDCELPVTTAVNVAHQQREFEIDRKLKAHSPSKNVYLDLVTLEGQLKLRNFEGRDARVVVRVPVPGKPVSASDGGILAGDPAKLRLLERAGNVEWNLVLEPGETKELRYKYERYVRAS